MKNKILLILIAIVAMSCDPKDSPELIEARAVHNTIMDLEDKIHNQLHEKQEQIMELANMAKANSDSTAMANTQAMSKKADALHDRFDEWSANLMEVPGAHDHDHGHDHDHEHAHDPQKEAMAKDMSDKQILTIQKDQLKELEDISTAIVNLK